HWRQWEPPLDFAAHLPLEIRREAFRLRYRLIAEEMRAIGIDADCAPMLDVPTADTHPFLLNRCYARDPAQIAALGRAVAEGLMAGGVLPVIKHVPGHGRAVADSHHELPIVSAPGAELEVDFAPFAALADLPMAMTAHVIYEALDSGRCATLSPAVIDMIRGKIGFDGLLMTDDLAMKALTGAWGDRVEASLAAGCDIVLHCNGEMDEKRAVAEACPRLVGRALERADAAIGWRMDPQPLGDAAERLERLLREDAHA
ncbi:MAG: glycoside hydrolase family 3 N-terminal domain-containing protein, partial [Rubricella sp.]